MDRITTNSFREGDSLSLRLSTLRSFYSHQKNIWDIGCDHGQLGRSFLPLQSVESVNLVDPSPSVVEKLKSNIKDSYITKEHIYLNKGQEINISSSSNIIFIAGMGGSEIGEIIMHLLPQIDSTSKFVISPHRKILETRQLLRSLPLSLENETLVFEDGRYYQMLSLLPQEGGSKVSNYGENIWNHPKGENYRLNQLSVYESHRDMASVGYMEFLRGRNSSNR